ncbi:MAG: Na+ dependent nucleoside transporter N-terminal domain-containing protein, partial [Flammeovirgaceae bacterium]
MNYLRAAIGLIFIVAIAYLLSGNRKKIDWRLVGIGILFQVIIGLAIAKVGFVRVMFEFISDKFVTFLGFAREGSSFVFGSLASNSSSTGFIFA